MLPPIDSRHLAGFSPSEFAHPDALEYLEETGVNIDTLSPIKEMKGYIWATPRSQSPIKHILQDCIKHPYPNRLDTLNHHAFSNSEETSCHRAIFTQQLNLDKDAVASLEEFRSDDDPRVTTVSHIFKRQGELYADGSYSSPWGILEHEGRHAVDSYKNSVAEQKGEEPEDLYAFDLLTEIQGEKNGIESQNYIASRFSLPQRTTYDEFVAYPVNDFTDPLPSNPIVRNALFEASAKLKAINEVLLRHTSCLTGDAADDRFMDLLEQQRTILDQFREIQKV